MFTRCIRVFALTVALTTAAHAAEVAAPAAKPKSRVHNAEFVMPDGWVRGSNYYGNLMLMPPGLKDKERCEIHICPYDQTRRDLTGHAQSSIDQLKVDFNNPRVLESIKLGRLVSGVKIATSVCEADEKVADYPKMKVHFTECDGGNDGADGACGIAFVANTPALWEKHWPTYVELLKTVTFPSHTRLAEARDGAGPLTMYTVNTCVDFCEWFMDVPFTQEQRAVMQQYMVDLWKSNDPKDKEDRDAMQEVIKASIEVAKQEDPKKKQLIREAMRSEGIKTWREEAAKGDKMSKFMIDIYDAANKPIAQGQPPLTRQSADATIEVLHFMASKAAGYDVEPSKQQKDEFAAKLAAAYGQTPADMKKEFGQMPLYWAALRVQWPELPADERKKLADAWAGSEQIKPIIEDIKKAKAKAAATSGPNAQLAAMQKLYQQQQTTAMISNMMAMQHRTNMTIINNIGSSNYRYEYKYVYRYR